jgi:predicted Zn-ribbon and HTH transcriptional regulator
MTTGSEEANQGSVRDLLQERLDAVPSDRVVACLPTHEALILHDGDRELGRIPLDGIVEVMLLNDTSVERSYPLGRLFFLGPLALLWPRKTIRESYRVSIQWKDPEGDFHFTYLRVPSRILADHMLNTIEISRNSEVRSQRAKKALQAREKAAILETVKPPAEVSPLVTCGNCTMEFRRDDLPPGGKCPVCGHPLETGGA